MNQKRRRGRPKLHNPIAVKLQALIRDPALNLTYEKIAVYSEIGYNTLMNVFTRKKVSYTTLKGLKYCGLINEDDEKEYQKWILIHGDK